MNPDVNETVEETGCGIEETCAMDVTKTLTEEQNKEMMEHALGGLDDLL